MLIGAKNMRISNKQKGVGLIEVLVALLIMAIGVLGFMAMQLKALRGADASYYRTQATVIANEISAHMTLNSQKPVFINNLSKSKAEEFAENKKNILGEYLVDWAKLNKKPDDEKFINPDEGCTESCQKGLAKWDVKTSQWNAQTLLPNGKAKVNKMTGSNDQYQIAVVWNDTRIEDCDEANQEQYDCVVLEVVL